ncbi:hypothetical protein HELRODRAFT_63568 [Helobdella robusta]|uniref:Carboxylic ester hydrolase n=1 Tax=Helobdella robusta TaxID=6412 RepID=T1FXH6_HELRO|nr:hypothetical protein HELRODRAFT_63568 [Helobdella robusta]ESO11969.1 hypothetical protein HELRODRAFT_63568 [Helobdella robusta]
MYEYISWFIGVPYATPPINSLRFRKTVKAKPWLGVRRATKFGYVCPQNYTGGTLKYIENEDCLFLNIYSPTQEVKNKTYFPVMVFIHGGSYLVGSGNTFQGDTLAQHGVVVVTINYRLGVLGFLSAKNSILKGNYGLHDQIEALKWIQENIRSFGGDPNQVTIFGNSAGGSSVGILSYSPAAKGLFKQAIMQSGSASAFWAQHTNDSIDYEHYVRSMANYVGCRHDPFEDLVECLRQVPCYNLDFNKMQSEKAVRSLQILLDCCI